MENGNQPNLNSKIVYDCLDTSTYYESNTYINENEFIDLGPGDEQELQLAQQQIAQTKQKGVSSTQLTQVSGGNKRINRFYQSLKPYYVKEFEGDQTLIFESRFESGNLRRVVKLTEPHSYNLILKYDHDTTTYTQWFYFKMQNVKRDIRYKLTIINLVKPDSSYNQGQKPLFYSCKDAAR